MDPTKNIEEWERWFAYFDTPESTFRAAMQTDEYVNERNSFITALCKTTNDDEVIKYHIIRDFTKWTKNKK